MKKRMLAVFLSLVLTVALFPPTVGFAAPGGEDLPDSVTVQYYADLDMVFQGTDSDALPVINTSGKALPENGTGSESPTGNDFLYLYVRPKNNEYGEAGELVIRPELREIYASRTCSLDEMRAGGWQLNSSHYTPSQVWVLKEEAKSPDSTAEEDWTIYSWDGETQFAYGEESADEGAVSIQPGDVVRLVYEPSESSYVNAVNFYDYDITDGWGNTSIDGVAQGINNIQNYTEFKPGDARFAFGNANTGTGLDTQNWNGNKLNKRNRGADETDRSYQGSTFGLVTGRKNGILQYADGVAAPYLFDEASQLGVEEPNGKTSYDEGQFILEFDRKGDTYTLAAVKDKSGNTVLQDLEKFVHPASEYTHLWTNNFWPLDDYPGADGLTGQAGATGSYNDGAGVYPPSDNGVAHNNMFGMQYAVQFILTPDYTGPLEYYFFGDDDMWVFLDGELICDLGGIHSAVGAYVDLWDYLDEGDEGVHTLHFYYTERGLSGSTCYMQFTLPSVSSIPQVGAYGILDIEKTVDAGEQGGPIDEERSFDLQVDLSYGGQAGTVTEFPYIRYYRDGSESSGNISRNGGSILLKHSERIRLYLPVGTAYQVTEPDAQGYVREITGGNGTITTNKQVAQVQVKNTWPAEDPGSLTVTKTVEGSGADASQEFQFQVTTDPAVADGVYGDMTFAGGEAVFMLKDRESATAAGLPAGTEYTVTETPVENYTASVEGEEAGTIPEGGAVTVAYTNTYEAPYTPGPGPSYTSVTVKKEWVLDDGGEQSDFVTVELLRDGEHYAYAVLSDDNSWTYTWRNLNTRYDWTVAEPEIPDGFTAEITQSGRIFTIVNDDTPENPDEPKDPEDPDNPDVPDDPKDPEDPDDPGVPDDPGDPGDPDDPNGPETPEDPDDPNDPETPEDPDDPQNPENPDNPADPDDPGTPDDPGNPDEPHLPQTGQNWLAVCLLAAAGILLAAIGVFFGVKRRRHHNA